MVDLHDTMVDLHDTMVDLPDKTLKSLSVRTTWHLDNQWGVLRTVFCNLAMFFFELVLLHLACKIPAKIWTFDVLNILVHMKCVHCAVLHHWLFFSSSIEPYPLNSAVDPTQFSALYTVQCTIHCPVKSTVHCSMHCTVQCTVVCPLHCTVQCTLHSIVQCIVHYTVQCTVHYTVNYTSWVKCTQQSTVQCSQCSAVFIVQCTLHSADCRAIACNNSTFAFPRLLRSRRS